MKAASSDWSASCTLLLLSGMTVHCSAESPAPIGAEGGAPAAAGAAVAATAGNGVTGGGSGGSTAGNTSISGAPPTVGGASGGGGTSVGGAANEGGASGGSASGGGAGGGSAGAAPSDCGNDAILCETFERHTAASPPADGWTPSVRGDGKIVVDTSRAFSGKQSLHVSGRMNADRANISRPLDTDSPTAFVRFMMYATSYPASAGVHTRLMRIGTAAAASGSPDSSYSLASYNGTAIEKVNSIYLRDTTTKLDDPQRLNRWICWEFAVDRSLGVGKVKVQLWVDGRELTLKAAGSASHGMTSLSWDPIPFELFMLGLDGFQADTQPADFWIDDLAVTPTRMGCPVVE